MKIFKYPLVVQDVQEILLPLGFEPLSLQIQRGEGLYLWAKVDEAAESIPTTFTMFGTGQEIPEGYTGKYISTFHVLNGDYVFHVFYTV